MKFMLLSLVLALVASSAFGRRSRVRGSYGGPEIDMDQVMDAAGGEVRCDLCEMVVGDIQSILSGQENEIESFIVSMCDELLPEYQDNCTSLVHMYLPLLFSVLDDMTPSEACELLTMCTEEQEMPALNVNSRQSLTSFFNYYLTRVSRERSFKERRMQYMRSLVGDNYLCEPCEDTIGYIYEIIVSPHTWAEFTEILEPLCDYCPPRHRTQCTEFFHHLPSNAAAFANDYLNPQPDCQILGFCPADHREEFRPTTPAPEVPEQEPEVPVNVPVQVQVRSRVNVDDLYRDMTHYSKTQFKKLPKINTRRFGGLDLGRLMRGRRAIAPAGDAENRITYDDMIYGNEGRRYETAPADEKCELCRYVASAAEGLIQSNELEITEGLSAVFADICNSVPEVFRDECNREVKDVLPGVVYQYLLKLMEPDFLCNEMLQVCQSANRSSTRQ